MAEGGADKLKIYWDHFFKAETGTYEKSTWLDLFLAEFLIRVNDGANPKELIKFCPVSGVVTLVGCELLCGIHRVTSSINTHYSAPLPCLDTPCSGKTTPLDADVADGTLGVELKPEEAKVQSTSLFTRNNTQSSEEILRKYILGGVAWKCLVLLKALGVEGLSCCRQLSSVLMWVYGELRAAPAARAAPPPASTDPSARTPMHMLFSHKIWSKQKPGGAPGSKVNSAASSDRGSVTGRSRHFHQMKLDTSDIKTKRKPIRHSDQSSESGDSNDDLLILNRSLAIKVSAPNDDFEYFNSSIRSSNEYPNESLYNDTYYSPRKAKAKADDYMNDKHREIINSDISTFEFTIIITDLLQELCKAESSLSGSEGSQISVQCINFSLRNLCSLQFSSLPAEATQNNAQEVSRIKVALTELLIVSLDQVLIHSDLCAKLINSGILPMLLRILEDVISKSSNRYSRNDHYRAKEIQIDKTESDNLLKFVFGIAYSITAFFHCLLMQCRSIDKLREFTDQFRLYGECLKGGLLKECIELMIRIPADEDETVTLIKKLIDTIGKIVNGMKRVRSEVVHSAACPRSRHKVCRQRVAAGMHHHHDILGEASSGLPMSSACCISVLYGTLTSLLTDEEVSAQTVLRHKILRVMLNCGVCCCFCPGFLMESIVRLMLTHNSVASLCLQVLEHTVYGELGASVLIPRVTDQLPCTVCEPCDERRESNKFCQHGVSPMDRKSVFSFLIHYNSLLQLDNHNNVLHATVSHLLRVTPKCRMEMKYELLFSVIYPTFIVSKHRYIIRLEESARFLTVACLNIFASLLNTVSFAEQFIQKGGLSYVLELVSLAEFSNQCCSILEIAIVVEIFKLMKENSELTYFREMGSLASVQMLFKSLATMTDKCYKIYKLKLPEEKFQELCDVTTEREALDFIPASDARKVTSPKSMRTFVNTTMTEDTIEDHIGILNNIWTFWKTCAGLCLYSPMFREYVVSESVFLDSYALLKVLLYYLCNCEYGNAEMRVLIKIIEALLTMQFAVSDVTSGRSKDTSGGLVRAALAAPARALGGGGGLRALCEALVRVATTSPSHRHAMPRLAHPKVPPLLCPSGSSSAECSSSEDSAAAGPYASEHSHSEPADSRPDDGYEADVEITCKLDLSTPYRTRKISGTMSNNSNTPIPGLQSPLPEVMNMECAEYIKNGELAHPELCIIVVDILSQLIHKVVNCKGSEEVVGVGVGSGPGVGAALARACCARLAGALAGGARGGRAPPLLLHRLLAPNAAAAQLLARTDPHLEDLQRSILELVQVVAAASVEAGELAALLRLFAAPRPPLPLLLPALHRLFAAAAPSTPDCILTFPIERYGAEGMQNLAEELNFTMVHGTTTSQSHQAETAARKLQEAHLRAGIRSAWSCSAARCGVEGAGWAPWLAGFALLLWLRPHPGQDPAHPGTIPRRRRHSGKDTTDEFEDEYTESLKSPRSPSSRAADLSHVVSVGHDSLMFEVWLDTNTGTFTLRLSRPEASCCRVVSEVRAHHPALPRDRWACVALNVTELVRKRHIYVQVTIFINGYECETVSLPVQGILVRKVTPTSLLLGHAGAGGVYHLSHCAVYRVPVLCAATALHLTAHGPDHACQVRCESPNYPLVLTPNVLDSNIDWDQVFEISSAKLREVHDNLLLSFAAHAPNIINLYHQTVAMPTVFSGRVPSAGVGAWGAGMGSAGAAGASIPEALYPTWSGAPLPSRHRGIAPALYMLGGPDHLLFLFARVVELEGSGAEQAMALGAVLRASRVDNRLYAALHAVGAGALDMLLTVLAAPKCRLTHHLLKVILDHACSGPLLAVCGDAVQVLGAADCVVLEPALLVLLTKAWRHFDNYHTKWEVNYGEGGEVGEEGEVGSGSVWSLVVRCLAALVRDSHPRRAFNHYQMNRFNLMDHLLTACKERFLNSECGPLDPAASNNLVEVVRGLMGSPPLLYRLALLCDFLLLMHQASDTFVTHSRANFYFLLTSETQDTSELTAATKRRYSKRVKKKPPPRSSASSTSTDDNSLTTHKDTAQNTDGDTDKMESSMESTKQLKGIINMQIKEGRKPNLSSTSDISDTTIDQPVQNGHDEPVEPEAEPESEPQPEPEVGGENALHEYIVVDADDVNHTTVEMYTGGIYHQRRVRAGAAPGWAACEGLLLLLRDTIAALPDHLVAQAVCGAVQAEVVVVLGNHRAGGVRAALVRAAAALQRRAPPALQRRLEQEHYYVHLADQISLYEGSWELAAACATLLTKCDVPLEDQLDEEVWRDVSLGGSEWATRAAPLVALLPGCVRHVPLARTIVLLLHKLLDKATLKMIHELCLAEVVVRAVRSAGGGGGGELLPDLFHLLNSIALKALASQHSMQTITELHHMLSYIELSAESTDATAPGGPDAVQAAHDAQLSLFNAQLDYLEEALNSSYAASTKPANYFATVLTSAVSLGTPSDNQRVERTELAARHAATVARAVTFLITHRPREPVEPDGMLLDRLLTTLTSGVGACQSQRGKWWAGSAEWWAGPLQELFWWSARPEPSAHELQPRLLRVLYAAPPHALHALAPPDPQHMRKLAVYLLCIVQHIHAAAETGPAAVELAITDWARGWALASRAALPHRLHGAALALEAEALLRADRERWAKAVAKLRVAVAKVVFSKEAMAHKVTETAMRVTRQVVDVQNGERKAFMEHLRRAHAARAAGAARWKRLVAEHTHERGVWHDPRSYPASWQLDATEGAARVRVRLRRAHLRIHKRFLKPQHQYKADMASFPPPLSSVVGGRWSLRGGLVAQLQLNETVAYMARVTYVTVASEQSGELLLTDRCIHFVPEQADEEGGEEGGAGVGGEDEEGGARSWALGSVVRASPRRWCLQERALEVFLRTGHAHLLAFSDAADRAAFLHHLHKCHLPAMIEPDTLQEAMTQWRNGTITNWEYLMRLNALGGRTYNDLMQYPVLPFIIADYTSRILDLNDPKSFRDLSKPMAVQNKNREQHYINTYNDLSAARRTGCSPLVARAPHHYASLYSNSGGVLHYLVRLPPFTRLFLNYQDNNFDMPDRTFHSLATTWRLITNDSPTDVKELIPELFYLPELFHNNEGLNLGMRQCGLPVDSVELPAWAADARLFTLAHRQALEAPLATERLPHWIDLVFGYKQTGQAAIDAINVFPACTYYGFEPSSLEDEVDRTAAAAMVRTYGQAPRQLLRAPHPHRAQDITQQHHHHHAHAQEVVWSGVSGASWGRYCGSPALGTVRVAARARGGAGAGAGGLLARRPVPARAVAACPRAALLLAVPPVPAPPHAPAPVATPPHGHADNTTNQHGDSGNVGGASGSLALVTWGHSDHVMRLKWRRDARPDLLLHVPPLDPITKVTSCTTGACPYSLFIGHASGRVQAVRAARGTRTRTRTLHAHAAPLADVHACAPAALLATASVDGLVVLWDLNELTYIRTLPNRDMLPVTHVTVSETLSDVATAHEVHAPNAPNAPPPAPNAHTQVSDEDVDVDAYEKDAYKYKSLIRVHTVNATFVGSVKVSERVTCMCYSNAAEGCAVNAVAAGLASGGARLYSSWDLRPLLYIPPPAPDPHSPLVCLTYSSDSMILFGCYAEGTVVAWESVGAGGAGAGSGVGGRAPPVRILPAHALF